MLHTGSPRTRSLISIHTVHTLPSTGHSKTGSKRHQGSREHIAALRADLFAMIYVWAAASGIYCEQHHGRDVASIEVRTRTQSGPCGAHIVLLSTWLVERWR